MEEKELALPLEAGDKPPYKKIYDIEKEQMDMGNILFLILKMFGSMWNLFWHPKGTVDKSNADHTYIVPMFFAAVWLVLVILAFCNLP
ncbi:MAG: hypothetical protein PHF74_02685 [Dehalococcoidales bacterium]|nr:hypothetical protein [Dehalococcoidales bacterium]